VVLYVMTKADLLELVLTSPEEIKAAIRQLLVPMAITAYRSLLQSPDEKVRKQTADTVMGMVDVQARGGLKTALLPGSAASGMEEIETRILAFQQIAAKKEVVDGREGSK